MRLVYLAAGAAGMICGSCLRDNRLVATLRSQGRDALLVPLYTPIRTDERDVSERRVLFGGINVYLQQLMPLFRHTPRFFDRLLDSRALFDRIGTRASQTRPRDLGQLTVSVLRGEQGNQRKEVEKLVDALRELRPDVINLPNLMMLGLARRLKEELHVPIVCTLSGEDIFLDALPEPYRAQAFDLIRDHARIVDGFISLTRYYADHCVRHFGLDRSRTHYVPMGIATEQFTAQKQAEARPRSDVAAVGYLARVCPEKGLRNLVQAQKLLHQRGKPFRLVVGGWLGAADRGYFEDVQKAVREAGLMDYFEWRGELSHAEKLRLLSEIDVFSVPTEYPEAKGLSILEAMASGVPVVQPAHGSFPELIEDTQGGVLVPPGDPAGLAEAIALLMDDEGRRAALGRGAAEGVRRLYSEEHMAREAWRVYEKLLA